MDLATAERLSSTADPKGLAALKSRSSDPAAARAVAGQFGALLMQGIMQGSDGAAVSVAGEGVGGNIVSSLFASTMSQAAMSGDKLGLADMLFRAIEAKQQGSASRADGNDGSGAQTQSSGTPPPAAQASADGFALAPYWQGNGQRPLGVAPAIGAKPLASLRRGPAGFSSSLQSGFARSTGASSPTAGWNSPPGILAGDLAAKGATSLEADAFIQQLRPLLTEAGRQLGVSPRVLLAHAALETGWGRAIVGNNLFGIKAGSSWSGAQVTAMTQEMEGGQMVPQQASFRAYPSLAASVQDYVALISSSPRYQRLIGLGDDALAYGRGLVAGGYATDSDYARKLEAVASGSRATTGSATPSQSGGRLRLFTTPG